MILPNGVAVQAAGDTVAPTDDDEPPASTVASPPVLRCAGLRKRFGERRAVDGVGFEIAPGAFALVFFAIAVTRFRRVLQTGG